MSDPVHYCPKHQGVNTQAQEHWRKGRREKGQCGWWGCTEMSGDEYYCAGHKKAHRERMQRNRDAKRKAVGE
jgi:hypothetical protein